MCVNEVTGEKMIAKGSIPDTVGGLKVDLVGHYAVAIMFSDNHSTGIYRFETLRALCPCCKVEEKDNG